MNCKYPDFSGIWSYRKGCRCNRCMQANSQKKRYPKTKAKPPGYVYNPNKVTSKAFGGC